jgi:hypothetical protein
LSLSIPLADGADIMPPQISLMCVLFRRIEPPLIGGKVVPNSVALPKIGSAESE